MSHIPNSAMPQAAPREEDDSARETGGLGARLDRLAGTVKAHPKTAAAAGAAVAAGVAAAAAIPLVRARGRKSAPAGSSAGD